jgi:hypothetical protein
MKGITTPEIIGIILAVIAVVVALYIMWVKGWIPFLGPVDESTCKTNLIKACSGEIKWENVDKLCSKYFSGSQKSNLESCLDNPVANQAACDDFCATLY